jgi:Ecdysteroid kinase-like family
LDFQACHWGSPVIDLIYTLYTMAAQEVRDAHRDNLVCYYHTLFAETLQNIGYMGSAPTLHDLHLELVRCGFMEVLVASCYLPLFFVDSSKQKPNLNTGASVDLFAHSYEQPGYQCAIQKLMRQFLHKGFLEL